MRSRSRSNERRRQRSHSRDRKRSRSRDRKDRRKDRNREHERHGNEKIKREDSDRHRIKSEPRADVKSKWEDSDQSRQRIKPEPRDEDRSKFGKIKNEEVESVGAEVDAEKPSFALSGKLLEDTNVFNGVVIKYSEPDEARKPKRRWRFYVFKGEESLPVMHLHRQSAYLIGKDRKIADLPVDHPSCSRQHAVLQYRLVKSKVLPYIIDLGSSNGTFLNNQKIEPQRYVELREKDMLKFGFSSREYILLHENSDD